MNESRNVEGMTTVQARAVRWVDDEPFAGWVEVHLSLADGTIARLFDKPPVFTAGDHLTPNAIYPMVVALDCLVTDGPYPPTDDSAWITLAHGMEDQSGKTTFLVPFADVVQAQP